MLKEQLKILIKLATIDNELADKEANLIEKLVRLMEFQRMKFIR